MLEAIILAAGVGSRLAPVHGGSPKCLVPVAGRPILEWQLDALVQSGVRHVVIVTGYEADRVRRAASASGHRLAFTFVHNADYPTTNVLASWTLGSDSLSDDHFYLHGDTVFEAALLERLAATGQSTSVVLTVDRHDCGDEEMKVVTEGDRVHQISKALDPTRVTGEFTGVLRAPGSLLPVLRELSLAVLGGPDGRQAFFEAALQLGIDRGAVPVSWIDVTGLKWREVDFPEDLTAAERLLMTADDSSE